MQPQHHKEYTAADIERYHSGAMPPAEMHALEKAALDDPFLADALDGYVQTQTPAADMDVLKSTLQRRVHKVVPLYRRRWLSVAALVVLLAGFGWLSYELATGNKQDLVVQKNLVSQPKNGVATIADTTVVSPDVNALKQTPPEEEKAIPNTDAQQSKTATLSKQQKKEPARDLTFSKPHVPSPQTKVAPPQPLPKARSARIASAQKDNSTATEKVETFSAEAPDSNAVVSKPLAGYAPQKKTASFGDSASQVSPQSTDNNLSEVVVVGANRKKKTTDTASRVQLQWATPIGGLRRFNAYVAQQAPLADSSNEEGGDVLLSFDVDEAGNAINLAVENSQCAACDETAMRLIQQGAKWKKTTQEQKAKARIRF